MDKVFFVEEVDNYHLQTPRFTVRKEFAAGARSVKIDILFLGYIYLVIFLRQQSAVLQASARKIMQKGNSHYRRKARNQLPSVSHPFFILHAFLPLSGRSLADPATSDQTR